MATKDTWIGAPWIVKQSYLDQFPSIQTELPDNLVSAEQKSRAKKRKSVSKKSNQTKKAKVDIDLDVKQEEETNHAKIEAQSPEIEEGNEGSNEASENELEISDIAE